MSKKQGNQGGGAGGVDGAASPNSQIAANIVNAWGMNDANDPHSGDALRGRIEYALDAKDRLAAVPLSLFRQLVIGGNALRDLDVFACNEEGHDDDCECFWEQCERWAATQPTKTVASTATTAQDTAGE